MTTGKRGRDVDEDEDEGEDEDEEAEAEEAEEAGAAFGGAAHASLTPLTPRSAPPRARHLDRRVELLLWRCHLYPLRLPLQPYPSRTP